MLEPYIKVLATVYTALLIAAVTALLLFGGYRIKSPMVKGRVIQATMVDISQLQSRKTKETTKPTPKKAEPKKKPPVKKPPIKKEVKKEEPKKVEPKKKDPPRIVKKEPKVDTKAQELERKERMERQKKLKKIQEQRKIAEQESKRQEQELKELAERIKKETKTKPQQKRGTEKGESLAEQRNQLMTQYQMAVIAAVERQWNKPASANKGLICRVKVRLIPGGGVIDASIGSPCNANSIVKNSILAAIKKADPLPYKGFENVFDRNASFIFEPRD
jgi:colicin import membrane protein